MSVDIQKLGADAAQKGLALSACPYLRAEAMPAHTGEDIFLWRQRVEEWEKGWRRAAQSRSERQLGPPERD